MLKFTPKNTGCSNHCDLKCILCKKYVIGKSFLTFCLIVILRFKNTFAKYEYDKDLMNNDSYKVHCSITK